MSAKEKKRLYDVAYKKANAEKISAQKKTYYQANKKEKQEASRKYSATHKDIRAKYRFSEAGKRTTNKSTRKWRKKNKIKTACYNITNYAIKIGRVKRKPCQICGEIKVEKHIMMII